MTAADWIHVLLAFLCTLGLGSFTIALFRFRGDWMNTWASRYLAGQLVVLLLVLSTAFCPWNLAEIRIVAMTALALAWLLGSFRLRRVLGGRLLATGVAAVLVSAAAFPDVILVTQKVPLLEWDARTSWFFHGKAIFLDGRIDPAFFANPLYAFTLPDYPLFIAAQAAWAAQFAGQWSDYSVKAFLLFNFAAYVYLLWRVLSSRGVNRWLAVLFVALLFDQETYSYVSGCADNHYIIALVILLMALGSGAWRAEAGFVALLMAFAANVKNEGKVYVLLLVAAGGVGWALRRAYEAWKRGRRGDRASGDSGVTVDRPEMAKACALAFVLGVVPLVMWQVFREQHGIVNPVQLVQRWMHGGDLLSALSTRLPLIGGYIAEYCRFQRLDYVAGLLLLMTWLRLSIRARTGRAELSAGLHEGLAWGALMVSGLVIVMAYLITPLDCEFHLRTSAGRLLLLPRLSLYVLVFYAAEALWNGRRAACAVPPPG